MNEPDDFVLKEQLTSVWQILYDKVLLLTTSSADIGYIEHWFSRLLVRWADSELCVLNEEKDLTLPKQKVMGAFTQLLETRKLAGNKFVGTPDRCACCGEPLSQGLFNERGCLKCAAPSTEALSDLIRASTGRFTPEQLHKFWSSI